MPAVRMIAPIVVVAAIAATSCSSRPDDSVPPTTAPPLGTVVPIDTSVTIATRPPGTTATTSGTTPTNLPTTAPPRPDVERFVPDLALDDGMVSLDVTFVDGTTATVTWPAGLDLVSRGVVPYGWAFIAGNTARDFFIRPGPVGAVLDRLGGAQLVAEFPNSNGGMVGLWRPDADDVDYLGFQFDGWTVLVFDYRNQAQMSDADRALWAANFHGEETEDGFLLLSADDPLQLVYAGDYPVPLNLLLRGVDGEVKLIPGTCRAGAVINPVGDGDTTASECLASGNFTVEASGSETFQRTALDTIVVDSVEIATPPPPDGEDA